MREIKFRAWDGKEMWTRENTSPFRIGGLIELFSGKICESDGGGIIYQNPQPILMQFTGLKDKNGKEIYEGDILAYAQMGLEKDCFGDIRFHEGSFVLWMGKELSKSVDETDPFISIGNCIVYQIIGNIYENPELLK